MEQVKDISLFLNIAGGLAKGIEVLHTLYEHEKEAHSQTRGKLEQLQKDHDDLKQKHEELSQASPSLDSNKSVLG